MTRTIHTTRRLTARAGFLLPLLAASPVTGQGTWWDIGSGQAVTITCPTDPASRIEFPPYVFGDYWPPGTLVYTELTQSTHGDPDVVTVYSSYFNDGGCGCGGYLVRPCTYRCHYDEGALGRPEADLGLYRQEGSGWVRIGATLDVEADVLTFERTGSILGTQRYAIAFSDPTPVEPTTWGSVKALFHRSR